MLTNIHNAPAEENFCDDHENTIKLIVVEDYNECMDYIVNLAEWQMILLLVGVLRNGIRNYFSITDLTIENSYILLLSYM